MNTNVFYLNEYVFSRRGDIVNPSETIFNPAWSTVKTLKGKDQIIGSSSLNYNLAVSVEVAAEAIGEGSNPANSVEFATQSKLNIDGIINKGNIHTNRGRDIVSGTATAQVTAIANTVSEAIAIANTVDAAAIASSLASVEIAAVANGIKNSGKISTGLGGDSVIGEALASVAAIATATLNITAMVNTVAQAPMSEDLKAVAAGLATSLAQAKVLATGVNNRYGEITTGSGVDSISAVATTSSATHAEAEVSALTNASAENKSLALVVVEAIARTEDIAIAINNNYGHISTGIGADTIEGNANASDKAIAIYNQDGEIKTGYGDDKITAFASASESIGIYTGDIRTGFGADIVQVSATGNKSYGIYDSKINSGYGDDEITAFASGSESYGIYGGIINTGYGYDTLKASNFGGKVRINMGYGEDYVEGFGEAEIYGGEHFDTLSLGSYNRSDFNIHANSDFILFEMGGTTMKTSEFEKYTFADGDYSFHDLIA